MAGVGGEYMRAAGRCRRYMVILSLCVLLRPIFSGVLSPFGCTYTFRCMCATRRGVSVLRLLYVLCSGRRITAEVTQEGLCG